MSCNAAGHSKGGGEECTEEGKGKEYVQSIKGIKTVQNSTFNPLPLCRAAI